MTDGDKTGRSLPETPGGALEAGLYFVATPIGAARDITLRGLDILRGADVLAAEDTRTLRHLMEIHGVPLNGRPMIAYHDHNGAAARPKVLRALAAGLSVAYASEAGTPLVADPGFQLGRAAIAEGYRVLTAPGASAVLAALTVSGLPTDRFLFAGFPPNTGSARRKWLRDFAAIPATLVFYESPKRVGEMLIDLAETCGEERSAAVCRELTKRFEEVRRGTIGELAAEFAGQAVRGEIVVVVDRGHGVSHGPEEIGAMLRERLSRMSVKDAATEVAEALDMPRREIYQMALKMEKDE
ncbi:16S rRNA (cytidine(1402)-2'-O)-methyltransferase [Paenirhodobacter populi]|uniref:16S rRNA (cytidine(1402)-2'-O)-methyltransferase n=1 Tax=Paenirhodobacter populi TaxID=2306993 RepID=UPI000FE37F56|nr:16S rRNA (cytidine(1402)-2'-O)-methyltransferase [Sinirhodobacter populi]RWR09867.1 16S rRNA (cytidine(1402)-2'-O)-methyltransferase [Sinirhodobacter populi]